MTAILVAAALAAGYLLGTHQAISRAYFATQDWADRRTGKVTRWAAQPVYALLIAISFIADPIGVTRNLRAYRADKHRAATKPKGEQA